MKLLRYTLFLLFASVLTLQAAKPEARFNLLRINYTFNADGSTDYNYHKVLTLFTHTAMNHTYGETFISYNPKFQSIKINEAYTIQKNGTKISLPKNALIPLLPRCAAGAPDFNNLKEMVVVHTGLELGATIYLDYSIHTKNGFYPLFEVNETLQQTSPVKRCEVSITYPSARPLTLQVIGNKSKAKISNTGDNTTYFYTFKNIPALSREAFRVTNDPTVLRLLGSEGGLKKALSKVENELKVTLPTTFKSAAKEYTEDKGPKVSKKKALRSFVAQNFAVKFLPYNLISTSLRPLTKVCDCRYATTQEITVLLYKLLKSEDIKADIVAVYPSYINTESAGLSTLSNLFIRIENYKTMKYYEVAQNREVDLTTRAQNEHYFLLNGQELKIGTTAKEITNNKTMKESDGKVENGYTILTLPTFNNGIDNWRMNTLPSNRLTTLEIPSTLSETSQYEVVLEEKSHLLRSAYNKDIKNNAGTFSQTLEEKEGKVIITRKINLTKKYYTPKEYHSLRILLAEWYDTNNRVLLFKK